MKTAQTLTLIATISMAAACSGLTEPSSAPAIIAEQAKTAESAAAPAPTPPPAQAAAPAEQEKVTAAHILVAYQGALRAAETITRTKEQAKQRAEGILAKARKGEDFSKLADDNSDDPSAKLNHGSLGRFSR